MAKRARRAGEAAEGEVGGAKDGLQCKMIDDSAKRAKKRDLDKAYYENNAEIILSERRDERIGKKILKALEGAKMNKESISLVWDEIVEMVKQKPYMSASDIVSNASILLANKCSSRPPPVVQPASVSVPALGATTANAGNQHVTAPAAAMTAMTQMMTGMPFATGTGMPFMPMQAMMAMGMAGVPGIPAMMTMPPGGRASPAAAAAAAAAGANATSVDWRKNMLAMASAQQAAFANGAAMGMAMGAAFVSSAISSASATRPAAPAPAMTMGVNRSDIKTKTKTNAASVGNKKDGPGDTTATSAATNSGPAKKKAADVEVMDVDVADADDGLIDASSSSTKQLVPISAAKSPPGSQFTVPSAPSPTSIADLPISDGSSSNNANGTAEVDDGIGIDIGIRIGSDKNGISDDHIDEGTVPEQEDDQSTVDVDGDGEESANAAPKNRPEFDLHYVQNIGDGIFDGKIAQIDVDGVGKEGIRATLTFLPPRSSPHKEGNPGAMQALENGKATLKDHFEVDKEEIGGTEKVHSLDLEVSSDLYHTVVLSKPDRKCTCLSFVMFMPIEGSKDWWVPWLATNKDEQYLQRGYSRYLLEIVRQLARGFGAKNIYLEVGIPSMMPDYTSDNEEDDKDSEASKWARAKAFYSRLEFVSIGTDEIPEEVLHLCKEVQKGTHEVLKWDLMTT